MLYDKTATVRDRSGATLATVPCDLWRNDSSDSAVGEVLNWSGVCQQTAAAVGALVGKSNRLLVVDGSEYRVIDAVASRVLPNIVLTLRQVSASG